MNFTKNFINHNKNIFKRKKSYEKKIFLLEFNGWQAIHIIFSYLVNYFKSEKSCKIVAYECYEILNRLDPPWYNKYLWKLGVFLNVRTFKIFRSFGTDKFLKPSFTNDQENKAIKITESFFKNKPNLQKLENFKIEKVWIGDLIYDSFLKKYYLTSIDINSEKFKVFFKNSVKLCLFWKKYFDENEVLGVGATHAVYLLGIPLRIAQSKKIDCYSISGFNGDLINLVNSISYKKKVNGVDIHHTFYKDIFSEFSYKQKIKNLISGKRILESYLFGKKKLFYMKNKTFNSNKKKIVINNKSSKIKVVIFSHDFIDSPHIYGNHFFTDFKKWFEFLDKIIKKTDYEWYIKVHPASNHITYKEVFKLKKSNKKLKILKKNFPNNYLQNLGINFGLTVYGTIAAELARYGIRIINASKNNPHSEYNFSITPKNIKQYENLLLNLNKVKRKFKYKKNDLYLYHFVKNYITKNHLIFKNTNKFFEFKKKVPLRYTSKIYDYWLKDFDLRQHNSIINDMKNFIESKKYLTLNSIQKK